MMKLSRALTFLVGLTLALIASRADARPCCGLCTDLYADCLIGCGATRACMAECRAQVSWCRNNCIVCPNDAKPGEAIDDSERQMSVLAPIEAPPHEPTDSGCDPAAQELL